MAGRRRGRKRALGTTAPMKLRDAINEWWPLNLVAYALSEGRRIVIGCIVDDLSRDCLAMVVYASLGGVRVVRELDGCERPTLPRIVASDNGTELTSGAALR
jgi:putative transposase